MEAERNEAQAKTPKPVNIGYARPRQRWVYVDWPALLAVGLELLANACVVAMWCWDAGVFSCFFYVAMLSLGLGFAGWGLWLGVRYGIDGIGRMGLVNVALGWTAMAGAVTFFAMMVCPVMIARR